MNPTIQSGMHPDAESLTAFAEQLLPAAEREQILAHMSTCSRCREVVFLAQSSADAGTAPLPTSQRVPGEPRRSLFRNWRWAWVPVAAFAGLMGVVAVRHFRQVATETQMTAKLSSTDTLSNAQPANADIAAVQRNAETAKTTPASPPPTPQPTAGLKQKLGVQPAEVRDGPLLREEKDARQLDQKKSDEQKEVVVGAVASPVLQSPGVAGGSSHGTMTARAKSSALGGPIAANQFQQQNMDAQNALQQAQNAPLYEANKPAAPNAAAGSVSQDVLVQPQSAPATVPPAPAAELSGAPLTGRNVESYTDKGASLSKIANISLPNGHEPLSVATQSGRSIALDTAGALFLSQDGGKHWTPVQMQWTGRAVLVRTRPVEKRSDALQAAPTAPFELVNDKLQTWVSFDGRTWTAQPLPLQ